MTQVTRPNGIPADTPRILKIDPAGPPRPFSASVANAPLWRGDYWNVTQKAAEKSQDERAGGGPVSQARLDVEEDIELVVRDAFALARNRMLHLVESGELSIEGGDDQ